MSKHPENQQNGAQNLMKLGNLLKILMPVKNGMGEKGYEKVLNLPGQMGIFVHHLEVVVVLDVAAVASETWVVNFDWFDDHNLVSKTCKFGR